MRIYNNTNTNPNFKQFVKNESYTKAINYLKSKNDNPLNKKIIKSFETLENEKDTYCLEINDSPIHKINLYTQSYNNAQKLTKKKVSSYNFVSNDLTEGLLCTIYSYCSRYKKNV